MPLQNSPRKPMFFYVRFESSIPWIDRPLLEENHIPKLANTNRNKTKQNKMVVIKANQDQHPRNWNGSRSNEPSWNCEWQRRLSHKYLEKNAVKIDKPRRGRTCEGGGLTEKPRSAAIERASDIPPSRLRGFFPTQLVSLPIDIRKHRRWRFFLIQIEIDARSEFLERQPEKLWNDSICEFGRIEFPPDSRKLLLYLTLFEIIMAVFCSSFQIFFHTCKWF